MITPFADEGPCHSGAPLRGRSLPRARIALASAAAPRRRRRPGAGHAVQADRLVPARRVGGAGARPRRCWRSSASRAGRGGGGRARERSAVFDGRRAAALLAGEPVVEIRGVGAITSGCWARRAGSGGGRGGRPTRRGRWCRSTRGASGGRSGSSTARREDQGRGVRRAAAPGSSTQRPGAGHRDVAGTSARSALIVCPGGGRGLRGGFGDAGGIVALDPALRRSARADRAAPRGRAATVAGVRAAPEGTLLAWTSGESSSTRGATGWSAADRRRRRGHGLRPPSWRAPGSAPPMSPAWCVAAHAIEGGLRLRTRSHPAGRPGVRCGSGADG